VEDQCTTTQRVSELTLEGTTLLETFSTTITVLAGAELTTCTQGGVKSGVVEGEGLIVLNGGGELTASSETSVS
jgi:hypothetical protein